jgi:dipeptidyl aminopeptidase/acylaminoacyl peptidase
MTNHYTIAPYGTWRSPVTAALLVEQAIRISQVQVASDRVYWNEGRPSDAGRQVIVSAVAGQTPVDAIPAGFSARTQVHEYGGRCYAVHDETLVFSNWQDQRLWMRRPGEDPRPLTPEPAGPRADRYADPVITPDGRWLICVHEHHSPSGPVDNDLVALPLDPPDPDHRPRRLTSGHDFYAAPRLSPDGRRLAWIIWDHPDMPWDRSELWIADLDQDAVLSPPRRIAGESGESITQPRWSPAGVLHYISDRSGWWNLYDETGAPLCPLDAEFAGPDWAFGNSSYGFLPDGRLVAVWGQSGQDQLGLISGGRAQPRDFPFSAYNEVQPTADGAVIAIAASPTVPPGVVRLDVDGNAVTVIRRSRQVPIDGAAISTPEAIEFPTADGQVAHALFYAPRNPDFRGPEGERPPLIVMIHGGPTGSTSSVFNLSVQYWTTRGFAVADVDYRGSTGYGTAYRRLLNGAWGVADVADCAHVVGWLANQGWVDGRRAAIRGGSAGGFTTLAALAFTDIFAAGASHFGVADLELLARDTHKFEARYLDGMVGPWPEAAEEYRRRSPIHHVEQISCPLILFQGLEDAVVPPAQSELMYQALRERGIPVAYLAFEGEQHGFRQAATIMAVAAAELAFYGRVFGFTPDGGDDALVIANAEKLSPRA